MIRCKRDFRNLLSKEQVLLMLNVLFKIDSWAEDLCCGFPPCSSAIFSSAWRLNLGPGL